MGVFVSLTYILTGAVILLFLKPALSDHTKPENQAFVVFIIAVALYAVFDAANLLIADFGLSLLLQKATITAGILIGVSWLSFAIVFSSDYTLTRSYTTGVGLYVVVAVLVTWFNVDNVIIGSEATVLETLFWADPQIGFFLLLGGAYVQILLGTGVFGSEALKSASIRRKQALILSLAIFPAVLGSLANAYVLSADVPTWDFTIYGFAISGGVFAVAMYGGRFLDIEPIARQTVVNEMDEAVITLDDDNRVVDCNASARELCNVTAQGIGLSAGAFFDSIDIDIDSVIESAEEVETVVTTEIDSETKYYELSVTKINKPANRGRVVIIRDITEGKAREQELRDREQAIKRAREQLRQTIDLVPDPLFVKNLDDEVLLSNEANAELHRMTPEELEGKREYDIESDVENIDNFDKYRQREIEVIETSEPQTFEEELTNPNGDTHVFETTRIPFEATGTEEDAVLGYARDVTDRKAYAEELKELNTRLQLALEETDTGVWSWDLTTDEVQWDETSERLFGYENGEFSGTFDDFTDRVLEEDLQRVNEQLSDAIETGEQYKAEFRVRLPDGTLRWIQARGVVRFDDSGTAERLLGIQTNVTERKKREQELQEAKEEMEKQNERLEEFASVVSHDLRNPLGIAQGRAMMLEQEVTGDEYSDHLRPLGDALDRMEEIITDTLTLARQGQTVGEMSQISLGDLVERCWVSVETAEATLEIGDEITLQGDSDRLRHVFENLFRNAIEHGGDDVTIRVGQSDNGRLYVEDDGEGIPPNKRETVLEAGHTSAAGGTGFGLTIVKRVAEAHGWDISITEGRDGGARFEFDNISVSDN